MQPRFHVPAVKSHGIDAEVITGHVAEEWQVHHVDGVSHLLFMLFEKGIVFCSTVHGIYLAI